MIDIFSSLILGIVEGITEFLPISSTAHLILTSHLLGIAQTEYVKSFEIAIQSGAILAVAVLYWRRITDLPLIKKIIVAFIPTGIIGLALYKVVKTYLIGNLSLMLWALALGGIVLIFVEWHLRRGAAAVAAAPRKPEEPTAPLDIAMGVSYGQALALGIFQAVAMIPGVSRSGATIVGGLLMGIERRTIAEFSFLLAIPTMAAATGLDLIKNAGAFNTDQFLSLAIGFVASFITAIIAIRWLLTYIRSHSFASFGIYRIAIAIVFAIAIL